MTKQNKYWISVTFRTNGVGRSISICETSFFVPARILFIAKEKALKLV